MRRVIHHRCKAEEVAVMRLREHNLLPILVKERHAHRARHHHKGTRTWIARLVDALSRGELVHLDLLRKNSEFVFIEQ